jgi:hypothetical protein
MSINAKLTAAVVIYIFLFSSSIFLLAEPASASDYVSNYVRIPAVQNSPPKVGEWLTTPTVIVCEYAPVSKVQINSATAFWEQLGYRFYTTQYKHDPLNKCLSDNPIGYIVIHLVSSNIKMDDTSLAQTHFYVDNDTSEIEWAMIYMRADIRKTVLEHELGHALGFLHYNMINHLMNQKWAMGGWDKEGLENPRR